MNDNPAGLIVILLGVTITEESVDNLIDDTPDDLIDDDGAYLQDDDM